MNTTRPAAPREPRIRVTAVEKCGCGATYQRAGIADPVVYAAWLNRHVECEEEGEDG